MSSQPHALPGEAAQWVFCYGKDWDSVAADLEVYAAAGRDPRRPIRLPLKGSIRVSIRDL